MLTANLVVLAFLACKTSAWTPLGAVLDVPQEVDLEERLKADPTNCNVYYYLKTPLTCGEGNAFNKETLRCDSLENVAKFDPSCGEGDTDGGGSVGGYGQSGGGQQFGDRGTGNNAYYPQSQFGGDGVEGSELQSGADAELSQSQYEGEEGFQINVNPSQGSKEEFESLPQEYVGNVQKRDAEDDSFPTYSSVSGNEEGKGYESSSDSDQLESYSSTSTTANTSKSGNANEDIKAKSSAGGQPAYEGKEGGQEEAENGYQDKTDEDLKGYVETDEGNGAQDPNTSTIDEFEDIDDLDGYQSTSETDDGGTGESLDGYVKETYKNAGRRGRKSKTSKADRKSKKIGSGQTGEQTGAGLQSNDWENRRLKQGWAAFPGLVGLRQF